MALQPRLKEIWCAEIFEVSARYTNTETLSWCEWDKNTQDSRENNRKRERYEWWMGRYILRMPTGSQVVHSHSPYSMCAHLCVCLILCHKNVTYMQLYWQQHYHNLLHCTARKQQLLCEHVCLCKVERDMERTFWQALLPYSPSLILFFLSPPIISLHIR